MASLQGFLAIILYINILYWELFLLVAFLQCLHHVIKARAIVIAGQLIVFDFKHCARPLVYTIHNNIIIIVEYS